MSNYSIIDGVSNFDVEATINKYDCLAEFDDDWDDPFVDDDFEPIDEDEYSNAPCDTYGPAACSSSCSNYAKCMGWTK